MFVYLGLVLVKVGVGGVPDEERVEKDGHDAYERQDGLQNTAACCSRYSEMIIRSMLQALMYVIGVLLHR